MAHFNNRMLCYYCSSPVLLIAQKGDEEYAVWACGAMIRLPPGENQFVIEKRCEKDPERSVAEPVEKQAERDAQ